jgi:hypothetical protein
VGITVSRETAQLGDTLDFTARVINTGLEPARARCGSKRCPKAGRSAFSMAIRRTPAPLACGESREIRWRAQVNSLASAGGFVGPYAVWQGAGEAHAESVAARVRVIEPLKALALPAPIHAVRGEVNQVDLQLTNLLARSLDGVISAEAPEGARLVEPPTAFHLDPQERKRIAFPLEIAPDAPRGRARGENPPFVPGHDA